MWEVVHQSDIMSVFNKSSVNTVKLLLQKDGEPVIMFAFMRTGRKEQLLIMEALGASIGVDENTGECNSEGCDEAGHRYRGIGFWVGLSASKSPNGISIAMAKVVM